MKTDMKKLTYSILFLSMLFLCYSCEVDNYDEPSEILMGEILDIKTKQNIQTEAGDGGIRIKLLEYSWSDNPTPYYFYSKQDGSYNNTKIFKGNYNIVVEGAFVPLIQYDSNGNKTIDNSQTMDINGVTQVNFEVEPFLRIEWLDEPILNKDGSATVTVRITRGTDNADYQKSIKDVFLFVNSNPYAGFNNYDMRYSKNIKFSGNSGNDILGEKFEITTTGELPKNRTLYLRVGARIDQTIAGKMRYNYNEVKAIVIP